MISHGYTKSPDSHRRCICHTPILGGTMEILVRRRLPRLVFIFLTFCWSATAHAQRRSSQGDRFARAGTPRFVTFISYFAAMNAVNVTADLKYVRSKGFDGVRIWPNLNTGPVQVTNPDGSVSRQAFSTC